MKDRKKEKKEIEGKKGKRSHFPNTNILGATSGPRMRKPKNKARGLKKDREVYQTRGSCQDFRHQGTNKYHHFGQKDHGERINLEKGRTLGRFDRKGQNGRPTIRKPRKK